MGSAGSRTVTVVTVITLLFAPLLGRDGKPKGHKLADRTATVVTVECVPNQPCPAARTDVNRVLLTEQEMRTLARTRPRYRVKRGDTLASIARRFGVTPSQIRALNAMRPGSRLRVDSIIRIPAARR